MRTLIKIALVYAGLVGVAKLRGDLAARDKFPMGTAPTIDYFQLLARPAAIPNLILSPELVV